MRTTPATSIITFLLTKLYMEIYYDTDEKI